MAPKTKLKIPDFEQGGEIPSKGLATDKETANLKKRAT